MFKQIVKEKMTMFSLVEVCERVINFMNIYGFWGVVFYCGINQLLSCLSE